MNISSLSQNSNILNSSQLSGITGTQKTQSEQTVADILMLISQNQDSVSISEEGMKMSRMPPPPPPEEIDFANMSDEELTDFLERMQELTGSIPGAEDGTSVSDLTSEQLQSIRETLTEMSSQMSGMLGPEKMQNPPPPLPPDEIQSMSDEDLMSLLEKIQEETGSIPGVEDSVSLEVSELTEEQLQSVRDALAEMMQARMAEMMQSRTMNHAISAYTAYELNV